MVTTGDFTSIMKKLMRHTKNVTGANAYWNDERGKLRADMNQDSSATIFWTLSMAEFHWLEFHSLNSDNEVSDTETLRESIINNPHLLDWFFTVRVEKFVKHWLYEKMGAEWHWYRFELAVHVRSIHCRGLAKLKSDPGLCSLGQFALKGYYAQQQLASNTFDLENYSDLERDVCEGKLAEDQICNYADTITTAENPSPPCGGEWASPDIHPCKKKVQDLKDCELEHDYCELVNKVQRHTICNSGYCLRNSSDGTQYCRFKFEHTYRI